MPPLDREQRSPQRLSDELWRTTLIRVRGEFEEMPGLRLTREEAKALLGLQDSASIGVLDRLAQEGFLWRSPQGEYMRRHDVP